jgi:DNA-binding transcriptional LysR family regulator
VPYDSLRILDLNLLVALDVLLRERNVTRSAQKLGITQSAASGSLARLRRHFGDDLLHRTGKYYELTPLAAQLVTQTGPALAAVGRVFEVSTRYDPGASTRTFELIASDYAATIFGEVLARRMATRAPRISLHLQQATAEVVDNAGEVLKTVDGFLLPRGHITDAESVDLFDDEWVCVVSADNDEVGTRLTRANLRALPWVLAHDRATAVTPAARYLADLGIEPTVVTVVESFMPVPFLVAGTSRIALMQRRLAERLAAAAGVRVLPLAGRTERFTQTFLWHPIFRYDSAHRWLRTELAACADELRTR